MGLLRLADLSFGGKAEFQQGGDCTMTLHWVAEGQAGVDLIFVAAGVVLLAMT